MEVSPQYPRPHVAPHPQFRLTAAETRAVGKEGLEDAVFNSAAYLHPSEHFFQSGERPGPRLFRCRTLGEGICAVLC